MAKIQFPASSSLADINTIVSQYEQTDGPLTSMGNDGTYTVFAFNAEADIPANVAVVAAQVNNQPVIPPNSVVVCAGTIFIAGTLTPAAATRAN